MAEFKFNTSFQTKSGLVIFRGSAILVQDQGRIRTAHIVDIRDNLSAFYVTANVAVQDENTLDRKTPAVRYEGSGFYHLSEQGNPGINQDAKFFILPLEGEEAAIALHAHMTGLSDEVMSRQDTGEQGTIVHAPAQPGEAPAPDTKPLPQTEQDFDPADANKDGTVSNRERKQFDRENG